MDHLLTKESAFIVTHGPDLEVRLKDGVELD